MLIRNYGGHDKECQDCGQTYDADGKLGIPSFPALMKIKKEEENEIFGDSADYKYEDLGVEFSSYRM